MDKYLSALQRNLCSVCADSTEEGFCTLSDKEICAVEKFYPQIIDLVHSIKSESIQDYIHALRENICTVQCRMEAENSFCYLREDANCALDRHFPLIVEIIQQVDKYD